MDPIMETLMNAPLGHDRLAAHRASDYRGMAIRAAERAERLARGGCYAEAAKFALAARNYYAEGMALARRAVA